MRDLSREHVVTVKVAVAESDKMTEKENQVSPLSRWYGILTAVIYRRRARAAARHQHLDLTGSLRPEKGLCRGLVNQSCLIS